MRRIAWLLLLVSFSFGQRPLVRYFVQANGGFSAPWGDFDGRKQLNSVPDSIIIAETVNLHKISPYPMVELRLGANIDASAVAISLFLGSASTKYNGAEQEDKSSLQGLNFLYQYNWSFSPVEPMFGVGYGFTRLGVPQAAKWEDEGESLRDKVLFSGAGPIITGGLNFPVNKHIHLGFDNRISLFWASPLTTTANDYSKLDRDLWQWSFNSSLAVKIIF
ncbi:MAG: hypothetical protein GX801_05040 [Fibrobacter sp.]|nr:hypothetical protein [Fibrobacter sp.]